jgi:Ricin-type beta-trefoil lectin domain
VVLAQCFGRNQTQQWVFKGNQIIGVAGMCLDAQAANGGDRPQVVVAPCNGNPNQVWQVQGGHVVASDGRCLDVPGGNLAEGTPLTVSACSSSSSQQWTLR